MLARIAATARACARAALDFVLPARCLTCDEGVASPGQLCLACFRNTQFVTEPCCRHCGTPFASAGMARGRTCGACASDPPPWREGRAAMLYDDQARRILLPFKHADRVETARPIAAHMARAGAALLRDADLLVPVPLHPKRLLARRYNQSALLAQAVGRLARVAVAPDALRRVRHTDPLGGLNRVQRAATVRGAFIVHRRDAVAGRRVVLVDDVLTTGATAAACTIALLESDAASVDVLVAARVDAPFGHTGLS